MIFDQKYKNQVDLQLTELRAYLSILKKALKPVRNKNLTEYKQVLMVSYLAKELHEALRGLTDDSFVNTVIMKQEENKDGKN